MTICLEPFSWTTIYTCGILDRWDSAQIIGTSLYVHKSVATTTTTNHELRRTIPLFLSISNWIFGPTSPLYHRYYLHPWCRRKIFVWYAEMLPKYTAECPTIKNNTNNNAVTIASLFLYHRTLGIYPSLSSERHHRLPPTTVSCRTFTIDCRQRPFHVERTSNYIQCNDPLC